jgi:hypothetical protein
MSNKISFIVTFFSFVLKFCVIMLLCYCFELEVQDSTFYVICNTTSYSRTFVELY